MNVNEGGRRMEVNGRVGGLCVRLWGDGWMRRGVKCF